jgi:hypothetical protein
MTKRVFEVSLNLKHREKELQEAKKNLDTEVKYSASNANNNVHYDKTDSQSDKSHVILLNSNEKHNSELQLQQAKQNDLKKVVIHANKGRL